MSLRERRWFFLMGAPRCGTSALRNYLSTHPKICMPFVTREPHYFAKDLAQFRYADTEKRYLGLFKPSPEHAIFGEKSAYYLYSTEAAREMIGSIPDARFIVMVRDPVALAYSYYRKLLWTLDEDERSFERAWRLQDARRAGSHIPRTCHFPFKLQYRSIVSIGQQLRRLLQEVPPSQLKLILFEQFAHNPGRVYRDVLGFLGLPDDGRQSFPNVNRSRDFRSRYLHRLTLPRKLSIEEVLGEHPTDAFTHLGDQLKKGLARAFFGWNTTTSRPDFPLSFQHELRQELQNEIEIVADLYRRLQALDSASPNII